MQLTSSPVWFALGKKAPGYLETRQLHKFCTPVEPLQSNIRAQWIIPSSLPSALFLKEEFGRRVAVFVYLWWPFQWSSKFKTLTHIDSMCTGYPVHGRLGRFVRVTAGLQYLQNICIYQVNGKMCIVFVLIWLALGHIGANPECMIVSNATRKNRWSTETFNAAVQCASLPTRYWVLDLRWKLRL